MAVLAAAASLSVLVPLYRGRRAAAQEGEPGEVAIYKDQIAEIDRDLARGLIDAGEAGAARTEIARRLLKADAAASAPAARAQPASFRRIAAVAALAMPLLALAFYLALGSPQLPDQPLAARLAAPPEASDLAALIARVEAHLAAAPDDGRGWDVIAPVYVRSGRYADGERAYRNAIRILGPTAERESGVGDALVRQNRGVVTEDARAAFARANALDPAAPKPRFFLALALTQEGRTGEAAAAWKALLDGAPADAPWVPAAKEMLARLEPGTPGGPSPAQVEDAARLTPDQQRTMIEGMVAELAARLESSPGDADGWARLVRSYMVLGRKDEAGAALARARAALSGDAAKLAPVEAEARSAGLIE